MAQPQRSVTLRNPQSGLVLDAAQGAIRLQPFSRSPSQLWSLESVGDGKFSIINMMNGYALDVQGAASESTDVVTYPRNGSLKQQWFINSDKTIASAAAVGEDLVLDVAEGSLNPGSKILIYEKHGETNQLFEVQFMY